MSVPSAPSLVVPAAARANVLLLAQGSEMITRLEPDRYTDRASACFNSSAGGHFRHVIEHYQALQAAEASGIVDYEGRARDLRIETDAEHAREVMGGLADWLTRMAESSTQDRSLQVVAETVAGAKLTTTLARELEFLVGHTVHHYALIAVVAGQLGILPPINFGVAPSTLKHQQEQNVACAR